MTQPSEAASSVPEAARQGVETEDPRTWPWVEASVWTDRMLTALGNGVKGGQWFSLIDKVYAPATLKAAWSQVARNRGAAGVDRMSVARFKTKDAAYLGELGRSLKDGTYRPDAVRRVHIPKGKGQTRPLGIPTVKDRVVQAALKLVLEPIFEREFLPSSFGFRPGRSCKGALREVDRLIKAGYTWVVDADLKGYFDSIPHSQLMERVEAKISDGRVLSLIESFLQQDVLDGLERWRPIAGSPQGAVLSPLLANLYLHPLDVLMTEGGFRLVRYADDFVILCRTREEAQAALDQVQTWTSANGLTLHPDKTHLGDCAGEAGGFDFLGYRFAAGTRHVRKKSLLALREHIREKTRRMRSGSLETIIADLNPTLRGWFAYFQHANKRIFGSVDGFVRRRLRAILRRRQKRPGFGKSLNDHRRWPNSFFARHRLFTMREAWAVASRSR